MNRREFVGGLAGGVACSFGNGVSLMASEDKAIDEKAVIFIWLGGGASQVDLVNPCMSATDEYRGVFGAIDTKTGYQLGGTMENLSRITDKIAICKSFKHRDGNHFTATHWVMTSINATGLAENGAQKDPAYGAVIARKFGENRPNGLPTYVKVNQVQCDGAAFLGSRYTGYANDSEAIKNLKLNISKAQMDRRIEMVRFLERDTIQPVMRQWSDLRETSYKMMMGDTASAFDLKLEDQKTHDRYRTDKSSFGKSLLTAKRLVRAGSRMVTCNLSGFDNHTNIARDLGNVSRELDYHLSNLILDLEQEGLLSRTLIVVASEFGRSKLYPQQEGNGRNHHPNASFVILAGGNYGGQLIGTTDKTGLEVTSNPFEPKDLACTIFNHVGIGAEYKIVDSLGRPRHFVENDSRIII